MSILYFCIFFLKSCLDLKSVSVMAQWREKVTLPKKAGKSFIPSESFSIMADLVKLDYEGKSVGLTPMNLSKTTIARCFRVHEDGLHLKIVKTGKCENVWPRWKGKFLLPTGTKNACGCLSC